MSSVMGHALISKEYLKKANIAAKVANYFCLR